MTTLERSVVINATPEAIDKISTDPSRLPEWYAGIQEAMRNGVVAGFPVVDIKAKIYDGSFHEVDSGRRSPSSRT